MITCTTVTKADSLYYMSSCGPVIRFFKIHVLRSTVLAWDVIQRPVHIHEL